MLLKQLENGFQDKKEDLEGLTAAHWCNNW
jgi:hypothetical protein